MAEWFKAAVLKTADRERRVAGRNAANLTKASVYRGSVEARIARFGFVRAEHLGTGVGTVAMNSKIEWTDNTFNPWIGCAKVSPACDNCYAENLMDTRYGRVTWGAGEDRSRTAPSTWKQPRRWNRDALAAGTRPFVFCASLADVFDNEVDERWRHDLFELIEATPALVWLLLTKRIGNVRKMTDPMRGCRILPRNVAIGATMANQEEYDRDRMKLADVKNFADVLFTFGSFEPLLGPIILDSNAPDWIIVGGESGANARPMSLDWPRSMQRQSAELGRVFNFKQVGGRGSDKGGHELDGHVYFDRPAVPTLLAEIDRLNGEAA